MRYYFLLFIFVFSAISGWAQQPQLAEEYLDKGEFEKAEILYEKLYRESRNNYNFLEGWIKSLQEQEKYKEAEIALQKFLKKVPNYPPVLIELGRNKAFLNDEKAAEKYYQQALNLVDDNPNLALQIGGKFHQYNMLEKAATAFEKAIAQRENYNFTLQLAQIYGEQRKLEKMFTTFIRLIQENPRYQFVVNRYFTEYIEEDPQAEANQILRKILLKSLQAEPDILYNSLLSWLYIQENDFAKAFAQEKAIYKRTEDRNLNPIFQLAQIAAEREAYKTALDILDFGLEESVTPEQKQHVYYFLFEIKTDYVTENPAQLDREFTAVFEDLGMGENTAQLQQLYARFLAFKKKDLDKAKHILKDLLTHSLDKYVEAQVKMQLADILTSEENFNQALILYSQIKSSVKNTPLAQEALFKVAQTSYYKGDFEWAQTQLKVLKKQTSDLTANDAIALHLLISDNKGSDSTMAALKLFAKADLLSLREDNTQAIALLNGIVEDYKGDQIEDDALLRLGKLYEREHLFEKAEACYLQILEDFEEGILADDAAYWLAELYRTKLNDRDKAMEYYKRIIFDYSDSIFFTPSRKKYRELRGDDIL